MLRTTEREAAVGPAPPARPRLRLQPDQSVPTLLDGGWWPRSADPAAELPGLILALNERHGRITTRVMLGTAGWVAPRPRGHEGAALDRPGPQPGHLPGPLRRARLRMARARKPSSGPASLGRGWATPSPRSGVRCRLASSGSGISRDAGFPLAPFRPAGKTRRRKYKLI